MKPSKNTIERIEKRQQELRAKQIALAKKIQYESLISFLFNLSIVFEEFYANAGHHLSLQNGTKCLGGLILLVVKNREFPERKDEDIEALQARELGNLLLLAQHKASNQTLKKLYQLFEDHSLLEELRQIEKYDRSCEVVFDENGSFETKLIHLEGRNYDIKTGLKYQNLIDYYSHLGYYIVQHLIDVGRVTLPAGDEVNHTVSRLRLEAKIAASEYFHHFGIEDRFSLNGKTFSVSLLVDILSFLRVCSKI